jgi:hypothetical protein
VRIVREVLAHGDDALTVDSARTALLAHLARFNEELVRRAAAGPEPSSPEPSSPEPL